LRFFHNKAVPTRYLFAGVLVAKMGGVGRRGYPGIECHSELLLSRAIVLLRHMGGGAVVVTLA